MKNSTVSKIMLLILLSGLMAYTARFNVEPAKAWTGTVYIRADGSIDPPDAPIITYDKVTYILTDNITSSADGIVVERDNIIINGDGHTINGTGEYWYKGVDLSQRTNVTVQNTQIKNFYYGIMLNYSSNNVIFHNNVINSDFFGNIWLINSPNNAIINNTIKKGWFGIYLTYSSYNNIYDNNIAEILEIGGITLDHSSHNTIQRNNVTEGHGLWFWGSSNNKIIQNNINTSITRPYIGYRGHIELIDSPGNIFYYNNFFVNSSDIYTRNSTNVWDNGYPSGGNYWSDYTGVDADGDGIGDTPYVIDENNVDRYPLMYPWAAPHKFSAGDVVWAASDLHVRSGPGLNYSVIDTMIKGNRGVVISGPVNADGYNWWYINYSVGATGWSAENWLELDPAAPQAPKSFVYWAEAAVSWAKERLGRGDWSGLCMRFVANAFMQKEHEPAGYNAIDGAREFYRFDQDPNGWLKAPKGALIFFDKEGTNDYGHVGIYLGNGSIIHAYGTVRVDTVEEVIAKPDVGRYLGWSYPPESWKPSQFTFKAVWGSTEYPVAVSSNSIVTDFEFNQPLMQISFKISGEPGMQGYCNVTIPKTLLKGEPWTVLLNGTDWTFTATSNQTHSFIYFTYTHASSYQVTIQGTSVIPEIPTHLILLALMSLTIIPLVLIRKRRTRKTES